MKPQHASLKRLTRCHCCQSKHGKRNASRKHGNSAARHRAKRELKKQD